MSIALRVQGLGVFTVWTLGSELKALSFQVQFRVWGLWFRVLGSGFRV